jgi:hypothetical protein
MSTKPLCNFTRIGSRYTCLACGHVTLPLSEPPKRHCRANGKLVHVLPAARQPPCIHLGDPVYRLHTRETGCAGPIQLYRCHHYNEEVTRRPIAMENVYLLQDDGTATAKIRARRVACGEPEISRPGPHYRPEYHSRACHGCPEFCTVDYRDVTVRDKTSKDLPTVTLACIDCVDPALAAIALDLSRRGLRFARVVLLSHERPIILPAGIEFVRIGRLDLNGYNRFCLRDLHRYVTTSHILTIQTDGYVLRPDRWDPSWLETDYIGAPWHAKAAHAARCTVGNSGFCLRSLRLLKATAELFTPDVEAECLRRSTRLYDDITTCLDLYPALTNMGMRFAPERVASRFSFELPTQAGGKITECFGYHGAKHDQTSWLKSQYQSQYQPVIAKPGPVVRWTNDLPSHLRLTIATVCRTGGRYTPDLVRWFRRQLADNLRTPHEFLCLTDKPDEVPGGVALRHGWPGWWAKMELFRPGLFADGQHVIYFDLDTVFTEPFDIWAPPPTGSLGMVLFGKAWWTHYGSGVMSWVAPLTGPYDSFVRRPAQAMKWFPSDQEVIGPTIYASGGDICAIPGCEVQVSNGTQAIPVDRPRGPVWCAAGSGQKPWEVTRSWIPSLNSPEVVSDTALVCAWFGKSEQHVDAARRGVRSLGRLYPRPAAAVLVEAVSGVSLGFEWFGEHVPIGVDSRYDAMWIKESLWNLGARHVLATRPGVTKLVFCDLDTHPASGSEDWMLLVSRALDRCDICHPWTIVRESSGRGQWISYSVQANLGLNECRSGQGFAVAMTAEWFKRCGGWPSMAVAGSGDAIACMRWDQTRSHWDMYRDVPSMSSLVREYSGPYAQYGVCAGELVHEYHGDRDGPNQTRNYSTRHLLWDLASGLDGIVERDERGIPRWRDTALAERMRLIAISGPSSRDELAGLVRLALAGIGSPALANASSVLTTVR